MMEYKGYHAEIIFDEEDNYYSGRLYGINDLVMFGGETEEEVEADFHLAVEDYLEHCKAIGKEPNREMNPHLSFQVTREIHKSLLEAAKKIGKTPDELVEKILTDYLVKTA